MRELLNKRRLKGCVSAVFPCLEVQGAGLGKGLETRVKKIHEFPRRP